MGPFEETFPPFVVVALSLPWYFKGSGFLHFHSHVCQVMVGLGFPTNYTTASDFTNPF